MSNNEQKNWTQHFAENPRPSSNEAGVNTWESFPTDLRTCLELLQSYGILPQTYDEDHDEEIIQYPLEIRVCKGKRGDKVNEDLSFYAKGVKPKGKYFTIRLIALCYSMKHILTTLKIW